MLSTRNMLVVVGLLSLAPGAWAACEGNATRAEAPEDGKRCCFDDLIWDANWAGSVSGMFCKPRGWVRPGGSCTIRLDGKTVASTKCGHPEKGNGKFEVECSSSKGRFSTSYSTCSTGGPATLAPGADATDPISCTAYVSGIAAAVVNGGKCKAGQTCWKTSTKMEVAGKTSTIVAQMCDDSPVPGLAALYKCPAKCCTDATGTMQLICSETSVTEAPKDTEFADCANKCTVEGLAASGAAGVGPRALQVVLICLAAAFSLLI